MDLSSFFLTSVNAQWISYENMSIWTEIQHWAQYFVQIQNLETFKLENVVVSMFVSIFINTFLILFFDSKTWNNL